MIHLKFKNGSTSKFGPVIDKRMKDKITIATTTEIPGNIAFLLDFGIKAVVKQLEEENILSTVMPVQILVTNRDEISLEFLDEELATVISLIMYPIHKWIEKGLEDIKILVCIVEEFAHFYWNIQDEVIVNDKVLKIIERVVPNTTMETLYDKKWLDNNQ